MSEPTAKLEYAVQARRVDAHGSLAVCKDATITIDTDLNGRRDAFNPAELLLGAVAACMLKSIERLAPLLQFEVRGVSINLLGIRQDVPPKLESIHYEIELDTDETDQRIALLHTNVRKYGTVFNTVAPGTDLQGIIRRGDR